MDIVLTQDVAKLGKVGDVIKVKDGYGRNYLLPKKMAFVATTANIKRIDKQKKQRLEAYEQEKSEAQALAEELAKASVTINVEVNDQEKLYGSVTEQEVSKALEDEGFKISKKQITLDDPIEELGIFEIGVKLHSEVTAKVRLWVTKK